MRSGPIPFDFVILGRSKERSDARGSVDDDWRGVAALSLHRFFALPAKGLSDARNAMRIGTPGMSKASRRLLVR